MLLTASGVHLNTLFHVLFIFRITSLQARYANLPASPAGLLGRFTPSGFALAFRRKQKRVSIDSKCSETHRNAKKNLFTPMTDYALSSVAQILSGEAQPYLPHVTRRVPRSAHAKFQVDRTKTVGARGIQTDRQTELF